MYGYISQKKSKFGTSTFILLEKPIEAGDMADDNPVSDNANMVMNVPGQLRLGSRYSQIVSINHDYHVPGVLK